VKDFREVSCWFGFLFNMVNLFICWMMSAGTLNMTNRRNAIIVE